MLKTKTSWWRLTVPATNICEKFEISVPAREKPKWRRYRSVYGAIYCKSNHFKVDDIGSAISLWIAKVYPATCVLFMTFNWQEIPWSLRRTCKSFGMTLNYFNYFDLKYLQSELAGIKICLHFQHKRHSQFTSNSNVSWIKPAWGLRNIGFRWKTVSINFQTSISENVQESQGDLWWQSQYRCRYVRTGRQTH